MSALLPPVNWVYALLFILLIISLLYGRITGFSNISIRYPVQDMYETELLYSDGTLAWFCGVWLDFQETRECENIIIIIIIIIL